VIFYIQVTGIYSDQLLILML